MHDPRLGSLFWHNLGYYLTFTFQLSPDSSHLPLLIVWSLCVEELFYLFLPLIFLLGTKVRVAFALGCIVGLLLTPRFFLLPNGTGTWFLLPLNLFFGVGLALLRPKLTSLFPFIAIGAVALLVINCFYSWFHSFGPISALLCTTTVWSLAAYDKKMIALFSPLRWMGKLSYGIYLLHLLCISLVVRILLPLRQHPVSFDILAVLITLILSVLMAWLLQIGVEDPFLRMRRALDAHPFLERFIACMQVCLIPVGVLLAALRI